MRAPDAAWVGAVLGGRYRIDAPLSAGGMGAVYEATQLGLGRKVAVKVMHPLLGADAQAVGRFEREARLVAGLGHPNIVQVIDFQPATTAEPAFIVMELVQGRALATVLKVDGALPPDRVVAILLGLLGALEAAHAVGAVHRDLKPSNVMVTHVPGAGEVAKVLDFGIAKLAEGEGAARLTQTGVVLGTPMYMAPEQALGERVDGRADLYAAGMLGWVLLAGKPPFPRGTTKELLTAVIETTPASLSILRPDVPMGLDAVLATALSKRPDARFQSAAAMASALRAIADVRAPSGAPPRALGSFPPGARDATTLGSAAARPVTSTAPSDVPPGAAALTRGTAAPASAPRTAAAAAGASLAPAARKPAWPGAALAIIVGVGVLAVLGLTVLAIVGGGALFLAREPHVASSDEPRPTETPVTAPPAPSPEPSPVLPVPAPTPPAPAPPAPGDPLPARTMRWFVADATRRATPYEAHARLTLATATCVGPDGRPESTASCGWMFVFTVPGADRQVSVAYMTGAPPYATDYTAPSMLPALERPDDILDSDAVVRLLAAACPSHGPPGPMTLVYNRPLETLPDTVTARRADDAEIVVTRDASGSWSIGQRHCP